MKRVISIVLLCCCLFASIPAFAADMSPLNGYLPEGIDLTPFSGEEYTLTFDKFTCSGSIDLENSFTLEFGETISDFMTFSVIIATVDNDIIFVPIMKIKNTVGSMVDYIYDGGMPEAYYMVDGRNSYKLNIHDVDGLGNYSGIGVEFYKMLREISTSENEVSIIPEHGLVYERYKEYVLTDENKTFISDFCDACEAAGILDMLFEVDDLEVINKFN